MRWIMTLLAAVTAAACAELDRSALDALAPQGEGFTAHLARNYKTQALAAEQAGEARTAARLGTKALAAGAGLIDGPDALSDRVVINVRAESADESPIADHLRMPGQNRPPHPWVEFEEEGVRVSPTVYPILTEARRRLIDALARGARHARPAEAASAQAAFDCWAGRVEGPAGDACRADFSRLMAVLETATAGKGFFVETADSGNLRPCPKDERLTRHYSMVRESSLSVEAAEILDRARMESAAGQACSETPVR